MFILVTYDIQDDKKRNKIASILEDFGTRVQYSVFECNLTEKQVQTLRHRLVRFIGDGDSIRYYRLCTDCLTHVLVDGEGKVTKDPAFYIV